MIPGLVRNKRVMVDGKLAESVNMKIDPEKDRVMVDGIEVFFRRSLVLMLYKPKMTESSNMDGAHPSVLGLIGEPYSRLDLNIAGRLDADAEGLMLLTNDGTLLHRIISPNNHVEKTYLVKLADPIGDYSPLLAGVTIQDGKNQPFLTSPARIEVIDKYSCKITISEGKYHQVKRMFAYLGNQVTDLKRISIGKLSLDTSLAPGSYRELTEAEIAAIFAEKTV